MRFVPIAILWLLLDTYVAKGIATATSGWSNFSSGLVLSIYWLSDLALIAAIFYSFNKGDFRRGKSSNTLMGFTILSIVPKLFTFIFFLIEDFTRLIRGIFSEIPARNVIYSEFTLTIAGLIFIGIIYGLLKGKHSYRLHRIKLDFKDLPDAFHGFTITQLSDIHSGSFTNANGVEKGIELANKQKSDIIVFTGDLVNNTADEMTPWINTFAKLEAKLGKFSVLGNHDYGDYVAWHSAEAKAANLHRLKEVHREIGFRLLLNENIKIEKNGQAISLLGVENWGKRGFAQYGDLNAALNGTKERDFKILLSHDPSHWEGQILHHPNPVHLTLSGHTHGMQFGFERFGFKWSPIKYIYKQWAGAYQKVEKYLYVNRGFGFLGFPGRVGILPEITVIELVKAG
ncbi:MAG: metallophosphoesterase [Flavobacteriales bacterium]